MPGAISAEWRGTGRRMANRAGWAPTFAAPALEEPVQSVAPPPSQGEIDKWHALDNRASTIGIFQIPDDQVVLMKEKTDLELPFKFLDYVGARTLKDKEGKLLCRKIMLIIQRSQLRNNYKATLNIVMVDCLDSVFNAKVRRFSGIMKLPTVPSLAIRNHLMVELERNVPRSAMGRSTFAYERLVRYLFAAGLGLTAAPYIELDMRIRLKHREIQITKTQNIKRNEVS